jgi:POT family proton-dependent oligopeptide transporter
MKSTMTAIWLLVVSLGNLFTAAINDNMANHGFFEKRLGGANYEWFFVGVVLVFTIAFMFVSPNLKERSYIIDPYIENQIIADTDNL